MIKENGHFIRELALSEEWMLEAALDGRLVSNLMSLEVHGLFDYDQRFQHNRKSTDFADQRIEISKNSFAEMDGPGGGGFYSDEDDVDYEEYSSPKVWERLVQIWQLIASNHNLQNLGFVGYERWSLWPLGHWKSVMEFLVGILMQMPRLHHIKIGAYAVLYILQSMATIAPHITSFVYTGGLRRCRRYLRQVSEGLEGLHDNICTTLRSSMLDWNMRDSTGFRTVLRAFPSPRNLILPVLMENLEDRVPVIAKKRSKAVHDHLERSLDTSSPLLSEPAPIQLQHLGDDPPIGTCCAGDRYQADKVVGQRAQLFHSRA